MYKNIPSSHVVIARIIQAFISKPQPIRRLASSKGKQQRNVSIKAFRNGSGSYQYSVNIKISYEAINE